MNLTSSIASNSRSSKSLAGDLAIAKKKDPATAVKSTGETRLLSYNEIKEYKKTENKPTSTPQTNAPSQRLNALDIAEVKSPSAKEIIEINTGVVRNKDSINARKQMISFLQMQESKRIIAGGGSGVEFRDVDKIVKTYGGIKNDWVKMSSSKVQGMANDPHEFETHWIENLTTGQKVEFKTILIKGK